MNKIFNYFIVLILIMLIVIRVLSSQIAVETDKQFDLFIYKLLMNLKILITTCTLGIIEAIERK